MDIKRCDRCGAIYEQSSPPMLKQGGPNSDAHSADITIGRKSADLCQKCWNEFLDFWKYDEHGNIAYDEHRQS